VPGAVFSGSVDGHIRAFAAEDGHLLWDFDTARDFPTVNGVRARGGSLDGGRACDRRWHALRKFGLPPLRRYARQRIAAFSLDEK
jgi:hypothetical protein